MFLQVEGEAPPCPALLYWGGNNDAHSSNGDDGDVVAYRWGGTVIRDLWYSLLHVFSYALTLLIIGSVYLSGV